MNKVRLHLLMSTHSILGKYNNSNGLLNFLLSIIDNGDLYSLVESGETFKLSEAIDKLNDDQKRTFYFDLITKASNLSLVLFDSSLMSNASIEVLGELLYNENFISLISQNTVLFDEKWMENQKLYNTIDKIDIQRILSSDILFEFYCKKSSLFYREIQANFTQNQLEMLCNSQHFWALKYTDLSTNLKFIENLITNNPNSANIIFKYLPEEARKSDALTLALILSGRLDKIEDMSLQRENYYSLFQKSKDQGFQNGTINASDLNLDLKLYEFLTGYSSRRVVNKNGFDNFFDECTDEEKKNIYTTIPEYSPNQDFKTKITKILSSSQSNLKKIREILFLFNEIFEYKISNDQIESFLNTNSKLVLGIVESFSGYDALKTINNLYHSICNETTDLFSEFVELQFASDVNMYYITPKLINELGIEIIKNIAIYPESFYHLKILEREGKLELYKKLVQASSSIAVDKMKLYNMLVYSCTAFPDLISKMLDDNKLDEKAIMDILNLTEMTTLVNINNLNSPNEYYKLLSSYSDKGIEIVNNIELSRELFCYRFFKSSFNSVLELYESFKKSQDNISESEYIEIFNVIKDLIECNSIDAVRQIYSKYKSENFIVNNNIYELTAKLKEDVIGTIAPKISGTDFNINDLTGKNFEMAIHVVGAYGSVIDAESLLESWNSESRFYNTGICTSIINDDYLGHAPTNNHSVIFGFNNIESKEVQLMGPYDLYSNAYFLKTTSYRKPEYYDAKQLVENTRSMHNEVVINRNLPNGTKRQPSYILCFDKINSQSKKASEAFGIPIIFIDVEKHIMSKLSEIENLKKDFISSQSVNSMKKIITMTETLYCGLLANNKDLANKYFSSQYITDNILFLIKNTSTLQILEKLEKIIDNECDRQLDTNDHRSVKFSGDIDVIKSAIQNKRDSISLSNFEIQRKKQQEQDLMTLNTLQETSHRVY